MDEYYNKMLEIKINKINNNLKNLIDDDKIKNYMNCSDVIKYIEELDNYKIYPLTEKRTLDVILFELISGNIIRSEQLEILNEINNDIKIGKYDKVYEILMGRGKTSTITPLIILNNYIYNKEIEQYNIVLPNSLVVSSFDIINKLIYVINDYKIKVNDYTIKKNIINITSDENIKNKIIKYI